MNTQKKIALTTLISGGIALPLGHFLWPPAPGIEPPAHLIPHFAIVSIVEAIGFGLGVSLLIFGYPLIKKAASPDTRYLVWAFFALVWMLISWWPHDNLHMHIGMDFENLIFIEYGFHVSLIISSLLVTYAFITQLARQINSKQPA